LGISHSASKTNVGWALQVFKEHDDLHNKIEEATSRTAGLILRALEMAYGRDKHFELVRRSVLSSLGQQGLYAELIRILTQEIDRTS